MSQTFLITGGAGFIGSNLAAEIARRFVDASVIVFDDFRTGTFRNLTRVHARSGLPPFAGTVVPEGVETVDWHDVLAETAPRAVFHLGAITDTTISDEAEMLAVNTEPFARMLDAALTFDVPLVYASSAATYGSPPAGDENLPFTEEMAGEPNNIYGFSKWLMECEHRRVQQQRVANGDMPGWVVGLRFFNVFGPGEDSKSHMASMVHQIAAQMLEGKRPRVFADGTQARDQVPVEDVVSCLLAAAGFGEHASKRSAVVPGIYNLGSGRATSFNDIIATLREALGISEADLPTDYFDMPAHIRRFYQDFTQADMTATTKALHWSPAHPPSDAIARLGRLLRDQREPRPLQPA